LAPFWRSRAKNRAFRCNSSAPAGLAGFPLQSLAQGRQTVLRHQHGASPTACLYGLKENRDQPGCMGDQPLAPHGLIGFWNNLKCPIIYYRILIKNLTSGEKHAINLLSLSDNK
jgi:hypothetical protein